MYNTLFRVEEIAIIISEHCFLAFYEKKATLYYLLMVIDNLIDTRISNSNVLY
jgi:hypothetical protein